MLPFEKMIKMDPDDSDGFINKTEILLKMGKIEEALKSIEKVIKMDPDNSTGYGLRSEIFLKIGKIEEIEGGNLKLRYEDIESGVVKEVEHDMVVLSTGILANDGISSMFKNDLKLDQFNYVMQQDLLANPAQTNIEGVYVAGTASGPMDIPDSILSAGAASAEIAGYLMEGEDHEK